ncbi:MAG: endonuclease MutS2 [Fimbriimonadia bacterium]|nr:endonuclease MutS2 [Fimbriimonadia bacterium]
MDIQWDAHSLEVLEFPLVRQMWAARTETPLGQETALQRPLSADLSLVQARIAETTEACAILLREPPPALTGCQDIRPALERAKIGGMLIPPELWSLLQAMKTFRAAKEYLLPREERYPRLAHYAAQMSVFRHLEHSIETSVDAAGEVLDSASDLLAKIRAEARRAQKRALEQLQAMLHNQKWRDMLQEPIYTMRSGRYCLPVRSEYKNRVKGIVHDSSMSGATVFIEPEELVQWGNRLRELQSQEQEEIERVLYGLSRAVEAEFDELMQSAVAVAELDAVMAAGRLAADTQAVAPEVNNQGIWKLRQARHPLLNPADVVPTDIELGQPFQAVLITGPNTGGKTVCLKTVGLLTLMALLGLHTLAREGTKIAIPQGVFADIGDEQSLQQSLSTFSGHIRHIARYLKESRQNSLVLLDEVGAGTDPTEGAALAKAILLALTEKGARVLASTHYGELKAFAYEHPAFQNAAMEFDMETLRPTYRLRLGVPGASHAISIAQRLGLPESLIQTAQETLGSQQVDLMRMLEKLEQAQREAEQAQSEYADKLRALEERERQLNAELESARAARREARQDAQAELQTALKQVRAEADEVLRALRQASKESKQTHELRQQLDQVIEQSTKKVESSVPEPPRPKLSQQPLKKGIAVRVEGYPQVGTLLEDPREGKAQVQLGAIRMTFDVRQIQAVELPKPKSSPKPSRVRAPQRINFMPFLDLHGKRVEEALELVERFIDDALLGDFDIVRISHGKGTGALRQVVRDYLKTHPEVQRFYDAEPEHGGDGTTLVKFKR